MRSYYTLFSIFLAILVAVTATSPAIASYSATVLEDSPLAYWRLGEASGNTAYDSSGNGRDATYSGPTLGQAGAIDGDNNTSALFIASEGDTVQRSDSSGLIPGFDSWSVEAWVKAPSAGRYMEIVSWYAGGYLWGHDSLYILGLSSEGLPAFNVRDQTANSMVIYGPTSKTDGSWHHLVGVLDREGGRLRLYVDGIQVTSAPLGSLGLISDIGIPVNIGGQYRFWTSDYRYVQGLIDEVAIYRGALSDGRVRAHYDAGGGLSGDSDGDGVPDAADNCPNTPPGSVVDGSGCVVTQCFTQDQITLAVQKAVAEKDAVIAEKDALIAEKDKTISLLNIDVNALIATIALKDGTINSLNAKIASMYTKEQFDKAVLDMEVAKNAIILQKDKDIADMKADLANKDILIKQLEQNIAALNLNISTLNTAIAAKDQTIADLNAKIATMFTKAQLDQAILAAQQTVVGGLSTNLDAIFGNSGFVLPGTTVVEQITNLVNAIGGLPKGQIDKLKQLLTP